jgi:hypothetical protein
VWNVFRRAVRRSSLVTQRLRVVMAVVGEWISKLVLRIVTSQ